MFDCMLGAVHILCQPKMGGPDPPPPLVSQKSEISLPALPRPLSEKNLKLVNPPSAPCQKSYFDALQLIW